MEWNGIDLDREGMVNNVESISLPIRKLFEKTEHYSCKGTRVTIELSKLVHIYVGSQATTRFSGSIAMEYASLVYEWILCRGQIRWTDEREIL